jgi:mRNA interferase MazF
MVPSFETCTIAIARFPYSDLSNWPIRPVVVLAKAGPEDWVLGQITTNADIDGSAIELTDNSLDLGSLRFVSYYRPNKLFAGNESLIIRPVARLKPEVFNRLLNATLAFLGRNRI